VIEVNRDLTVEQVEMLDETLKKLGLVKATKITLHDQDPRRIRPPRPPPHAKPPVHRDNPPAGLSEAKGAQGVSQ